MKRNLFDYFKSSQDNIKLESSTQENDMLLEDTVMSGDKENKSSSNNVSFDSSILSEVGKEWPSDQKPNGSVKKKKVEAVKEEDKISKKKHEDDSMQNEAQDTVKMTQNTPTKSLKEERYRFLLEPKDKFGRSIDDEDYDKSTLLISEDQLSTLTPFERQFWEIKKEYFDTIVFFKKGKFYELYEEDADISAKLFNMKITERVNMRMTGFPESSYDEWASRFLEAGYKIARVDQSENAIAKQMREKGGKKDKIIKRELVEVITQGTIYDTNHLKTKYSSYLCAIRRNLICGHPEKCKSDDSGHHFSILLYDASTSTMHPSTFCDDQFCTTLRGFFLKYPIMEYLSDRRYDFGTLWIKADKKKVFSEHSKYFKEEEYECYCMIQNYLTYLKREDSLRNVKVFPLESSGGLMRLETSTIVNMELFETKENKKTLFNSINYCSTPGGERMLRSWLLHPLCDYSEIKKRQIISKMLSRVELNFNSLGDPERLLSKLSRGRAVLKDLNTFLCMLKKIVSIYNELENKLNGSSKEPKKTVSKFLDLENTSYAVHFSIKDDLERTLENFLQKYSVSKEEIVPGKNNPDELNILLEEKEEMDKEFVRYLEEQKVLLGCGSLNYKSIGKEIFQIEIASDFKSTPKDWFLVSKTKTTNRFYNKTLKGMINRYVEMEEKIFQSQGNLLSRAIDFLLEDTKLFEMAFRDISYVDCLISFSLFSQRNDCCTPEIGDRVVLKGLRNPIYPHYIPNDYQESSRILILTGSNMSGKSTFMRSVVLNIILFQMGMSVCADSFTSPLYDRVFTRVGASDNLLRGESTFMVELSEISTVLRNATDKSFVLVDELGRGTSVEDGKKIAKAVVGKLKDIGCRVLFSTHYHNLITDATSGYMASKIVENNLVFLYKLREGVCNDSNGIYVAKLAGVPLNIVERAWKYREEILKRK